MDYVDLYFAEVMDFRRGLRGETDRGCALMAAAYLHDQLGRLVRAAAVDDAKVLDLLLESSGPLGTFSSRIDACYSMGLLPALARRDLHLIRKIRNEFAHTASPRTFDEPAIASRCAELHYAFVTVSGRTRGRFTNAAMGVCAAIHSALAEAQHASVPSDANPSEDQRRQLRRLVEDVADEVRRQVGGEATDA